MKHKVTSLLVMVIILFMILITLQGINSRAEDPVSGQRQSPINESQFPIVDESAPEPKDLVERARRQAKGRRFHRDVEITSNPNFRIAARVKHWPPDFPALPVDESSTIIRGEVVEARAFVSPDRTAVYSEFSIKPLQVLKDQSIQSAGKDCIVITRYGGRVRFPDGGVQLLYNTGQGMPRLGGQYLLFLKREGDDFDLLTGYELSTGKVVPLDVGTPNFSAHANQDVLNLMNRVQEKIANSKH